MKNSNLVYAVLGLANLAITQFADDQYLAEYGWANYIAVGYCGAVLVERLIPPRL